MKILHILQAKSKNTLIEKITKNEKKTKKNVIWW